MISLLKLDLNFNMSMWRNYQINYKEILADNRSFAKTISLHQEPMKGIFPGEGDLLVYAWSGCELFFVGKESKMRPICSQQRRVSAQSSGRASLVSTGWCSGSLWNCTPWGASGTNWSRTASRSEWWLFLLVAYLQKCIKPHFSHGSAL